MHKSPKLVRWFYRWRAAALLILGGLACGFWNKNNGRGVVGLTSSPVSMPRQQSRRWYIRSATPEEVAVARSTLFRNAMNPLSLEPSDLLVATYPSPDDDTNHGREKERVLGFGQLRPLDSKGKDDERVRFSELASLYVFPDHRHHGIGTDLVRELLRRQDAETATRPSSSMCCLLTLKPTIPFYGKHGFRVVSKDELKQLPRSIQLEFAAGSVVSMFLGNDLVCMVRPPLGKGLPNVD